MPDHHLDLGKLDEIHRLALRAAAKGDNPVLAEMAREMQSGRMTAVEAARSTAYSEALAEGAGKLMRSAAHLRPIDISTDVDDRVLDRAVSEMTLWVEQFEKDRTPEPVRPDPEADDEYFTDRPIMTGPPTGRPAETGTAPERARWTRRRR